MTKKQVGLKQEEDGVFWMEIKDIEEYFSQFTICKMADNYKFSNIRVT